MLVLECFVDGDIVVAPTEVSRCRRLHAGTSRTGNAVDVYIAGNPSCSKCRKHRKLNASSKASGIGHMGSSHDVVALQFGKSIYEVMIVGSQTIVLGQVDDASGSRKFVTMSR